MLQAAQARRGNYRRFRGRFWLDRSSIRSVLFQGTVNAVFVVIADVIPDDSAQVLFIQRDHVIEDLAATTSDPSFGGSVLPWRLYARPFWFQPRRLEEGNDVGVEDRIAVQNDIAVWTRLRKGLSQLLHSVVALPTRPRG